MHFSTAVQFVKQKESSLDNLCINIVFIILGFDKNTLLQSILTI